MITGKLFEKFLLASILLAFLCGFSQKQACAMDESEWRQKQKGVIETVQHLVKVGTRYPAYRCGLYVPGRGVCYMKMTAARCEGNSQSGSGVSDAFASDVAEVIEVSNNLSKRKVLEKNDFAFIQSRFTNTTYLRILTKSLVKDIASTPRKSNLLAFKKLLEDIVTYIDGTYNDKKSDVWVSDVTERFTRGALEVQAVQGEGLIIPDKAIIIYYRFPGLYKKSGEKALVGKLYEALKASKTLSKYYGSYDLVIGAESGPQLLYASYPIKKVSSLKRGELKYFRYFAENSK